MTLSINYQNRVKKEIINTNNMINKELSYCEDLQKQDKISELRKHIVKLENMLK